MASPTEYTITCTMDATNTKVLADGTDTYVNADVAADVGALTDGDRVVVLKRDPMKPLVVGIAVEV